MNLDRIIGKITSGETPTGAMVAAGVITLLIALKAAKGTLKIVFLLIALALLAGGASWHFHHH